MRFTPTLRWQIDAGQQEDIEPDFLRLLDRIVETGNLRRAAADSGRSYRSAWALLRHYEERLGMSLLETTRGRGTRLTALGAVFRETLHEAQVQTAPQLESLGRDVSRRILRAAEAGGLSAVTILASDCHTLDLLRHDLVATGHPVELHFLGSEIALQRYHEGECRAAGFHLPQGRLAPVFWQGYNAYLDQDRDRFLLLDVREQGLICRPGLRVRGLVDIADQGLRFVNRQPGSGTRRLLDTLLRDSGIAAAALRGFDHEEHTHLAVASLVAAGIADVGPGVRTAAERFELAFVPLAREQYYLAFAAEDEQTPLIRALRTALCQRKAGWSSDDDDAPVLSLQAIQQQSAEG